MTLPDDLQGGRRLTIAALGDALSTGRTSARRIAQACLDKALDPSGQGGVAFVDLRPEAILAMADMADDARLGRGLTSPLAGIPIAIKDLFDVAGEDTRAGSLNAVVPAAHADAAVVARLRSAGMVPFGRTNMTEFAYSGLGINPHYGTPLCSWRKDQRRIAGGSTSGGAVAVAEAMVPAALGSDTGGSCRIPAAFCGLVGFKPTACRVPVDGMAPLSTTLDSVGWLTNSVDCAIALDLVLTQSERAECRPGISGLQFVVPDNLVHDGSDPTIAAGFDRLCRRLRQAGVTIVTKPLASIDRIAAINARGGFTAAESYAWHRRQPAGRIDQYDPRVRQRIERGSHISAADYIDMLLERQQLIKAFNADVADYDAVLFPTVPILPPKLDDLADDEAFGRTNLLVLRNSTIVNMVDGCAINLPLPGAGGPAGLTLARSGGGDHALLGIAAALEAFLTQEPY